MRNIKLFLWLILFIFITAFILNLNKKPNTIGEAEIETSIPTKKVLDMESVIDKLSEDFQIVGLVGSVEKEFVYEDNKWNGKKSFSMKLHGKFKFGINVADIKREDILISNGNIIIKMPEIVLISLEVPYNKIEIEKSKGWFRSDFSEDDRQLLYKTSKDSILKQILNDESIINNASMSSQNAIKSILMMIPEVDSVSFR